MKLRVTVTLEYDWEPAQYGTTDKGRAALIDEQNFVADPEAFIEFMVDRVHEATIKVEPAS